MLVLFRSVPIVAVAMVWAAAGGWWASVVESAPAWFDGLGWWGAVLLAGAYVPAAALCIPVWPLTFLCGYVYGVGPGFTAAWLGKTAGAWSGFVVARWLFRDGAGRRWLNNPRFAQIFRGVERRPTWIVGLSRLSPLIPYNVLNYAFGVTRIPLGPYLWASLWSVAPTALLYVYIGATAHGVVDAFHGNGSVKLYEWILFAVGMLATVALVVLLKRAAGEALAKEAA